MSPSASAWRPRSGKSLCIAIAVWTLTGCASSMKPSPGPPPLVIANCPEIPPQTDPSFGATVQKLTEIAMQYRKCRAAALGQ